MIAVDRVTKTFGHRIAVDNVSLAVEKKGVVGLLGANGAGKTTLMRLMTGYLLPTWGAVHVDGKDLTEYSREAKRMIGYLPEVPPLYPDMTVEEYLRFSGRIRDVDRSSLGRAVRRVTELCGIGDVLGRLNGSLSKGFQQRVGLAQALIHEPRLLILDEPTTGLDPRQIMEIRKLIGVLGQQSTIILSSHMLQEVRALCESVAILHEGRLLHYGKIDEALQQAEGHTALMVKVSRPRLVKEEELGSLKGVAKVVGQGNGIWAIHARPGAETLREELAAFFVRSGAGLVELRTEGASLEEIFLNIVEGNKSYGEPCAETDILQGKNG